MPGADRARIGAPRACETAAVAAPPRMSRRAPHRAGRFRGSPRGPPRAAHPVMRTAVIVVAFACAAAGIGEEPEPADRLGGGAFARDFDVIVVGAGPGGIAAAVQASDMGQKVAL